MLSSSILIHDVRFDAMGMPIDRTVAQYTRNIERTIETGPAHVETSTFEERNSNNHFADRGIRELLKITDELAHVDGSGPQYNDDLFNCEFSAVSRNPKVTTTTTHREAATPTIHLSMFLKLSSRNGDSDNNFFKKEQSVTPARQPTNPA